MRAYVTSFRVPKDGSSPQECEDAVSWWPGGPFDAEVTGRVLGVVSDGASESLLARHWARHLCDTVLGLLAPAPEALRRVWDFAGMAVQAADEWQDWVTKYVARRAEEGRPVQWYEEPGLARGDHATLLAVHVDLGGATAAPNSREGDAQEGGSYGGDSRECRWFAAALGDSCFFQVRDRDLLAAFPLASSADFDTSPPLLGSAGPDVAAIARHAVVHQGVCQSGDDLYLATDALAAWFLSEYERGRDPSYQLRDLTGQGRDQPFADWTAEQRKLGLMRNDDVGLLHISLG